MSLRYLLPCECGQNIAVQTSQAGQSVPCATCGKTTDVPMLRNLRQLPVDESADAPRATVTPTTGVTPMRALFGGSFLVFLIALAVAGILAYGRNGLDVSLTDEVMLNEFNLYVDSLTLEQTAQLWTEEIKGVQGPQFAPQFVQVRQYHQQLGTGILVSLVIAIAALITASYAGVMSSERSRNKKT